MSRRKRGTGGFSLFAFQDIITSVTGIVLLMTLMFAVELLNRTDKSPKAQTEKIVEASEQSLKTAEEIERELAANHELIDELREKLDRNRGKIAQATKTSIQNVKARAKSMKKKADQLRQDLDHMKSEIKDSKKRRKQVTKTLAAAKTDDSVKQLQAKLKKKNDELEKLKKSNRIVFNPGGATSKTAWLVEVTESRLAVVKAGEAAPETRYYKVNEFLTWSGRRDSGSEYFVLLVKPDGVPNYNRLRGTLLGRGFDVGYDVLSKSETVATGETSP